MRETVSILISEEAIRERVAELGAAISADYADKSFIMVCVLKGAVVFMTDLARKVDGCVQFDFIGTSSYGDSTSSSGKVNVTKEVSMELDGQHVLLVEDILDTGHTLSFLRQYFLQKGVASFKTCVLLDKPDRRVVLSEKADYVGFSIPDQFVIGYGLDYAQRYRNLPYVGLLNISED